MEFVIKVEPNVAGEEIKKWLDYKCVKPTTRSAYAQYINKLIESVMYGIIEINKDFSITHNLNFPLKDKESDAVLFNKLTYKPRLTAQDMSNCLNGNMGANTIDTAIATGAALSGEGFGIVSLIDSTDLAVLSAIGVFFSE